LLSIAQLHWAFPPVIGGVESHLAMLGPGLAGKGCRVSLLTGSAGGLPEEDWYEGVFVRRSPLMDLNSLTPEVIAARSREIRREIESFIDRVRPGLIHAHNMHYFSPVHADVLSVIKEERGIPLILTAHNVWTDDDGLWREMNKRAHIWDAVIAVSNYIKRELVRAGYDEKRVTVVHHGIDLNRFGRAGSGDLNEIYIKYPEFKGRRIIFHPARMSLDKGCHISVGALNIIKKEYPDVLLVLAGTARTVDWGSQQQGHVRKIMDLVDKTGLRDHVSARFFAWEEMPLAYRAAEFCVYPSCFEEPFGLALLESMAAGKPVIVSRAGGMPEIVSNGVTGFVVEMGDERELADRCCRFLRNPGLCRQMGGQGRIMVERFWTSEVMIRHTLKVYDSLRTEKKLA